MNSKVEDDSSTLSGGPMRAAVCTELGPVSGVKVQDVPLPQVRPGQVLVRVRAAALNFTDVLLVEGRYQVRLEPPFVPGSEFAGEVVGDGAEWATPGTAVIGMCDVGAFAEYVAVDLANLRPLPDGLPYANGAGFNIACPTAYHALFTIGQAKAGETVVVTGAAGGVGLATVDIAHRLGLRVIAIASSDDRLALTREFGADETINYQTESVKERLKELAPKGVDLIVDPVGGSVAELALRATSWGSRFVAVGFASGEIPAFPLNLVLLKGVIVRGFGMSSIAANEPEAVEKCARTLTKLIRDGMRPHVSASFALDDVVAALEHVAGRRALGKIALTMD